MRRRTGFAAIAVIAAAAGIYSLNPQDLYNQMYPVEALKRDVFRICHDTNSTFVRALPSDRKECFDSMPHTIALAIGWARPQGVSWADALRDPSRQAELLLAMAAMPPRQVVVTPRSFADAEWARALSPTCGNGADPVATAPRPAMAPQPPPNTVRTAAAAAPIVDRLTAAPHAAKAGVAAQQPLPTIPLTGGPIISMTLSAPAIPGATAPNVTNVGTLSAGDVGDRPLPAAVPLARPSGCNGA
jgi:hypothetical protein